MTVGTFEVKAALKKCFCFELSKNTRLPILLGVMLVAFIALIGAHVAELVSPHYTLYDPQHSLPLAPFRVRITRVATAVLAQFFGLPILAGVLLLALYKQRKQDFNFSTLFSCYAKLPQFFMLALVMTGIIYILTPGELNLLGIYSSSTSLNIMLIIFLNIPVIILMKTFLDLAPLIIAEQEIPAKDAIKYSIFFMLQNKNWLKFILFQLALVALFFAALLPALIAMALASSGVHALAFIGIIFSIISFVLVVVFYPMIIHGYSYIYDCITANFFVEKRQP